MKELKVVGIEENEAINALEHHYKYSDKKRDISVWCKYEGFDQIVAEVNRWREFQQIRAHNANAAQEIQNNQPQIIKYKAPMQGYQYTEEEN